VSFESQILLCVLPAEAGATVGGASEHPGQFYRGLTAPKLGPDLLALSRPEDSSRPAFILRWSRPRDDILSRHLAHFFVGAHRAAVALEHSPAALVLRSPFTSLTDMGRPCTTLCFPLTSSCAIGSTRSGRLHTLPARF